MAASLEQEIIAIFSTDIYAFGGKFYKQTKGGPIGYRVTGACAQNQITDWLGKVSSILKINSDKVWLHTSNIEDIRHVLPIFKAGTRLDATADRFTVDD